MFMFYPIAAFGLFVAMKKSFILHIDSLAILEEMTFEQKGILFDAIYKHQLGEEVSLDFSMKMAFAPFKNQFIRDNEKYSEFIDKQKDNGSKGGRPKKPTEPNETQKTQAFSENPTEPKKAYNDSVSDNVSAKESKSIFVAPLLSEVELYFKENGFNAQYAKHVFDYYALNDWKDASGKKVKSWKQKMKGVWLSEEKRKPNNQINQPTSTSQERFFKNGIEMIRTADGGAVSVIEFNKMFG